MQQQTEFAIEYTAAERKRLFSTYAMLLVVFLLLFYFLLFPELRFFSATMHCHRWYEIDGLVYYYYGLYVGLPALLMLVLWLVFSWNGLRIILHKQVPLRGAKVFRKTRITYGRDAVLQGIFMLLIIPALAMPLLGWGIMAAGDALRFADTEKLDYQICVKLRNRQLQQ